MTRSYLDALRLALDAGSDAGRRRAAVLGALPWEPTPTTSVPYTAANRLLVITGREAARDIASRLPARILGYFAVPADVSGDADEANVHRCRALSVSGHLGRFTVHIDTDPDADDPGGINLASVFAIGSGLFDQVIDCSPEPLITAPVKPPGYQHAPDPASLDAALAAVPDLIGEFEKPKYFHYDPDICAHGRSGVTGCTRCIDHCPTDAIASRGERIEVDPHLCQGGGSCTAACPTGAITYLYPPVHDQLEFLRRALGELRTGDEAAGLTLLVFDNEHGRDAVAAAAGTLDGTVLPFAVEEIGSAGLDLVAGALAWGAGRVLLLAPPAVSAPVRAALDANLAVLDAVLGDDAGAARVIETLDELAALDPPAPVADAATFAAIGNKRGTIRTALTALAARAAAPPQAIPLPAEAPFGTVHVDTGGCTLCMGCVSVCPGNALQAGGEVPALRFIEANCVQCGLCTRACPESVISLEPRLHLDHDTVHRTRTLNEEEPFRCIRCDKPFATQAMIRRMTEKLSGHWMFDKPEAVNRLKMCEDCRVRDLFEHEGQAGAAN